MNDVSVPISRVAAIACWALMVVAFSASVLLLMAGRHELSVLFGIKSILWAAVGGVLTVRCMALRVCSLIRVGTQAELERNAIELHSIR